MKLSESINKYSLKFINPDFEREFNKKRNEEIKLFNIKFCLFFFLSTSINTIITVCSIEKSKSQEKEIIFTYLPISYFLSALSCFLIILSIFIKRITIHKIVSYINYLGFIFPIITINTILWEIHLQSKDLYAFLNIFYMAPRGLMLSLQILTYLECVFVCMGEFFFLIIYFYFTNQFSRIIFCFAYPFIAIILSYLMTKKYKQSLLFTWASNERKKYQSIFENMKSCFLNFSNKKIKFINKNFQNTILKNKTVKNFQMESEINFLNLNKDQLKNKMNLVKRKKENPYINEFLFIKAHSEQILNILLNEINSSCSEFSKKFNEPDNFISTEVDNSFCLDNFLNLSKETYTSQDKEMRGNFIFLGFKEMKLILDDNPEKIEKRKYEVYYRVLIGEEEEFEFMFNDISEIQENEKKLAELKYKSLFLSKIAHEFKNPLICITELITELDILNKSSYKSQYFNKSSEILKQIQSMSEYLIILIKDLDYFSNIQINKDPPKLEIKSVDIINRVIPFCVQIGESLLHKLNKNKIKIVVENNLPRDYKLTTDEIKLKQVLINLISNAVKFTNEGVIKIKISLVVIQNKIIFEVSDTGIGMDS